MQDDFESAQFTAALANLSQWMPGSQKFRLCATLRDALKLPNAKEAQYNRARIDNYNIDFPQSENPDHEIFGREPRNGESEYDDATLKDFQEYIDSHDSNEPLRSNWSDSIYQRSSEMEMRPSPDEMAKIWNDPRITYEVRIVGKSEHYKREMKIPVSGNIKYWSVPASERKRWEDIARKNVPWNMLPSDERRWIHRRLGRKVTNENTLEKIVNEKAPAREVSFEERSKSWALCCLGSLKFAPRQYEKKGRTVYRGELTDHGRYAVQDGLVTPQKLECPGSDKKFWKPLTPREESSRVLPRDVNSEDELQIGYVADRRLNPPIEDEGSDPYKDTIVVEPKSETTPHTSLEQKQMRDAVDRMLPTQSQRVANMFVTTPVKNYKEIGRALSGCNVLTDKTYERHGKIATNDALKDISAAFQTLAA